MSADEHVARQRHFYESRAHAHLQPREREPYAEHLAARLADALGLDGSQRVLEVGAGFGRFTFHLLPRCRELVALDLSPSALATLERTREARGIPAARLRTLEADLLAAPPGGGEPFDAVAGFFLLHHLPDVPLAVAGLAARLAPGGRLGFVEPNRRNPLFVAQVACCPDMTWREEKGMFRLSRAGVERAYRAAGLVEPAARSVGFFPPPAVNRLAGARRLERWLERRAWLDWIRPMWVLTARAPGAPRP